MKNVFLIHFLLSTYVSCLAQLDSTGYIKYTPEFKFREGIYLNFDQVKTNSPLPKSRIITSDDSEDPDFFDKILNKDIIQYYDNLGNKTNLYVKNVWGYSRNGFIYVKMEDGFYRITLIGLISHFIANQTVYESYYPSYYNYYYDPYHMSPYPSTTTEMRQYLLDFSTGRILDYNENSLEVLLMQDPALHDEYSSLSRKKRKRLKFVYIRKFNEKNPLYFPQN